jgi:hypothetical protein
MKNGDDRKLDCQYGGWSVLSVLVAIETAFVFKITTLIAFNTSQDTILWKRVAIKTFERIICTGPEDEGKPIVAI